MDRLEQRRKQLELSRVSLAKEELELKILEKQEEIKRLQEAVEKQKQKENELKVELEG